MSTTRTWSDRLAEPPIPVAQLVRALEAGEPPFPPREDDISTAALVRLRPRLGAVEVRDIPVRGPRGPVPARLYLPAGRDAEVAVPDLVWFHGGAFLSGDLDVPESHWVALELAARGHVVLTGDYVKAYGGTHLPEPVDDALAVWRWAVDRAREAAAPAPHLGGASAGAALVGLTALRLRDGAGPAPRSLLLVYPTMHRRLPEISAELRAALEAMPPTEMAFTPESVELLNGYLAPDVPLADAFAGEADLTGLPPTLVLNVEWDSLRASGELFARQLADAGVPVVRVTEGGAVHGHLDRPGDPTALASLERMSAWLSPDGG